MTTRVAIVVPVYKHSGLVWEALQSLAAQQTSHPFGVVLVNDGCPSPETDLAGRAFSRAAKAPLDFRYLVQSNRGLSGARNSGVEHALAEWPELEAIFLLDADNRLKPYAIDAMVETLDRDRDHDWFYPDFQFFGLDFYSPMDGAYSPLLQTVQNICEAGSLVRARVFRAGLRFDERLKQGFEDWDFWLTALEGGFRGVHAPNLGFRYRKRPESMLADSGRDRQAILTAMTAKHPWIARPQDIGALQAADSPRYLLITPDGLWTLFTDPAAIGAPEPLASLEPNFWRWALEARQWPFPTFVVLAEVEQLKGPFGPWLLWDLERRLGAELYASADIRPSPDGSAAIAPETVRVASVLRDGAAFLIRAETFRTAVLDDDTEWLDALHSETADVTGPHRVVDLPGAPSVRAARTPLSALVLALRFLKTSAFREGARIDWAVGASTFPERQSLATKADYALRSGPLFPARRAGEKNVGFVCPVVEFGGVERVAFQLAGALKRAGYTPHLIIFGHRPARLTREFEGLFETVSWFPEDELESYDGQSFLGTRLPRWAEFGLKGSAIGLLSWLDALVNCHSGDLNGVVGDLRRAGVTCVNHQHLVEFSREGRPIGHPFMALAYEHPYDAILCCSQQLGRWFLGQGAPRAKLLIAPNGPGFAITADDVARSRKARAARRAEGAPLRVVYLGRLDRQKGIDRLALVIEAVRASGADVAFRALGKAVMGDDPDAARIAALVEIEPPVFGRDALVEAYSDADVLILPSRYEGLPLSVIEAMTLGLVVVAADAGAVGEAVAPGTGFVIPQDGFVERATEAVLALEADRALLARMSEAAIDAAAGLDWDHAATELVGFLDARVKRTPNPFSAVWRAREGGGGALSLDVLNDPHAEEAR